MDRLHAAPELFYHEIGAGPPLVLLHGLAGTAHAHFAPLLEPLAAEYRLIAPDLPGHGRSAHLPALCTTRRLHHLADAVEALIDRLGLAAPRLLGYSDGAEVALLLAARLGKRVPALALWGVSGRVPPPEVVALYAAPAERIPGWPALRAELDRLHGAGQSLPLLQCWAQAMAAVAANGGLLTWEEAAQVQCPTLIVTGERDPFNPLAQVQALAARIPGARLMVLPAAGHDLLTERGPQLLALLRRGLL